MHKANLTPFGKFKCLHDLKHLQDYQDSIGLLTTSLSVIVMLLNMPTILEPFSNRQTDCIQFRQMSFFQTQVTFAGFQLPGYGYQVDEIYYRCHL